MKYSKLIHMPKKQTPRTKKRSNTIPGTKIDLSKPPGISAKKRKIAGIILVTVIVLYVINLLTGIVSYSAMTIICMKPPVTVTRFAGGNEPKIPGDEGYGPNFSSDYYCSMDDYRQPQD